MKTNFQFSTLCGTVYSRGNLLFTPDGNSLISPVGNQISIYDLIANSTLTLPFETRKDIVRLALSPSGSLLIAVDQEGSSILINYSKKVLLAHFNFNTTVHDIKFSPDSKLIAVTIGKHVQVWHAPGHTKQFAPFVLFKEYPGHYDQVTSLSWSQDSKFFLTSSKDMTCRMYAVNSWDFAGACLTGHNDKVIGAWFSHDSKMVFTVSRDGAVHEWSLQNATTLAIMPRKKQKSDKGEGERPAVMKWRATRKHYFNQNHAKVVSATFHPETGLLSVGFDSGIFGIWELPDFTNIQTLSISQNKIDTVAINKSGEWLAFGSSALGQLLVWEWQSESYVLKQQGHEQNMTCLDYSFDGQFIATGGDDGKVKLWSTQSGFCFVTFKEHSGAVKDLAFSRKKQVVFSASLDGTVRAYDLIRYRNFRTFTSPNPEQFNSVTVDTSGEIVCAASVDNFQIYVWSVQTGKLLEILSGHEAPISCLAFSPATGQLVSGSWDKSIRIWDIFARDTASEAIEHSSEVLAIDFSPNGEIIASTTLNGNINFWSMDTAKEICTIEGRKDISPGRSSTDKGHSSAGKHFTSIGFKSDGKGVIAGGNSKFVCLYDIASTSLLKRFEISHNQSLDRMNIILNSKNMTEAGPKDMIDTSGEHSDLEDRIDRSLPGVKSRDASLRSTKPEARTFDIKFSPTGRCWAGASTNGLIIYSVDDSIHFDPFDLDMEVTPENILAYLGVKEYSRAFLAALKLGETPLIDQVYLAIPHQDISLVLRDLGSKYYTKLIKLLLRQLESNPRLEFHVEWTNHFLKQNTTFIKERSVEYRPLLRAVHKSLNTVYQDFSSLCGEDIYSLQYLAAQSTVPDIDMMQLEI